MKPICVLAFHDLVDDDQNRKSIYSVTRSEFEQILIAAQNSRRILLRASELYQSREPSLAITFDDGLIDTFQIALPLLQKYRLPATVFIPGKYIGRDGYMALDELKEWQRCDCEVGAHGRTHRALGMLSHQEARDELRGSRSDLEHMLGTQIETMSYPRASETQEYHRMAFEAGFISVFTSKPDFAQYGEKLLGRFAIHATTGLDAVKNLIAKDVTTSFRRYKLLYHLHQAIGTNVYKTLRNSYLRIRGLR